MSWNKPNITRGNHTDSVKKTNRRPVILGLVAALVVSCGALLVWHFVFSSATSSKVAESKPKQGRIKEVKPAITQTNVVAQKKEEKKKISDFDKYNKLLSQGEVMAWKRPANWDQLSPAERTRIQPVGRIVDYQKMAGRRRFTETSDNLIERLLMVKPGGILLGEHTYDKRFVDDFLKSLDTPITVTEEDNEQDIAVKNEVIACRKELKDAYDRGEDIAAIMQQTEKEIHEMSAYSINLEMQFMRYRTEAERSTQDLEDFATAVNSMLKEKGLDPIKFPGLFLSREKIHHNTKVN